MYRCGLRFRVRKAGDVFGADRLRPPRRVLMANVPGLMNVQSRSRRSMASSTVRCRRAIGLRSAPPLTTDTDDSRTTCRTPANSRQRFTQSLQLRREIGFQRGVAAALLALAELTARHGDPDEAGALLAEALETARASRARGIQHRIEQSPACSPRSRS
jgi:hypothetical protein